MLFVEINLINLLLGTVLTIIASFIFGLGIVLQKKAVSEMTTIKLSDMNSIKIMFKSKTWLIGIILSIVGGLPYILAQGLIGVALGQPLMLGLQLAFVVIFGTKMLNEKLEKIERIGFLILLSSPIFLVLGFVTPPDVVLTSSTFILNFLIFFFFSLSIVIILLFLSKKFANRKIFSGLLFAIISGLLFAIGAVITQVGVEIVKKDFRLLLLGLLFLLFMLIGNIFATGIQQLAFQKGKVGIAISLQSTANLLLAIFGGILAFNQKILFPLFFVIGIVMILSGNTLLVRFQTRLEQTEKKKLNNDEPGRLHIKSEE